MFAVIEDGGRQYEVRQGEVLRIDYRATANKGDRLAFDRVLLANGGGPSIVGRPLIDGAKVEAEVVVPEVKGPKLDITITRRRKDSRRHIGHRQKHTHVRIVGIEIPGLQIVAPEPAPAPAAS